MTKGSNVHMKEHGYTWKDIDKSYWEGFDNAKNKMEKRIEELEEENAELKKRVDNLYNSDCWASDQLAKARELLAKWVELFKPKGGNIPPTPIQVEPEQFLKEIKENEIKDC